jgi:hypothetical protein
VLFDEMAVTKIQPKNSILEVDPTSRNVNDYIYFVGMMYRDDENRLMYVTTRVVVQKGDIVAYRAAHMGNYIAHEESNPIHVADVEKMLRIFLLDSQPMIVEKLQNGDPSPRIIDLETRVVAGDGSSTTESSAKRNREDLVEEETSAVNAN